MGRLLIWLSGARRQILAECPTERPKYVGVGTAILITGAMAAISLAFALITALRVSLWAALPFALAWGVAILCLDRLFVVSLQRRGHWWSHILRAVPRLLLALLLGAVISTPFILQIFRPEIEHEITQLQDLATAAYFKNLPTSPLSKQITAEELKVGTLQAEAAGTGAGTGNAQSPELTNLIQQRNQALTNQNNAYNSWQCQLYGPCKPPGAGPLAIADEARYKGFGTQVASLDTQISLLQQQQETATKKQQGLVSNTANSQLGQAQRVVAADKAEQQQETNDFLAKNKGDTGLLIRLRALDAVTNHDSTLNAARWLLFLLFVAIDCMPVFIKVMLNLGPENNYDKMLAAEEVKQLRVAASNRAVRQSAEIIDASTYAEEPRSRIAGWSAEIPGVTQEIIAARERVERERLRSWERDQIRRLRDGWVPHPGDQAVEAEPPLTTTPWTWAVGHAEGRHSWLQRWRWRVAQMWDTRKNGSQSPGREPGQPRRAQRTDGYDPVSGPGRTGPGADRRAGQGRPGGSS